MSTTQVGKHSINIKYQINRWLYSTNAKDIGVLYIIFAGLSGLVGSTLSFKIRKELAGGGNVYFLGSYHDYNVTLTAHAQKKIFFKVMPALIGKPPILYFIFYFSWNSPFSALQKKRPSADIQKIRYIIAKLLSVKRLNVKSALFSKNFRNERTEIYSPQFKKVSK